MPQHPIPSTGFLRSLDGTFGEAQIVALPSRVILDLQTRNYDTIGHLHRDSALADLAIATAIRLRNMLDEAIVAASDAPPVQPGVWSPVTSRAVAHRMRRGRLS
jgi:hypothetical protein